MKDRMAVVGTVSALLVCVPSPAPAQDLGPQVKKIRDGIYVYAARIDRVFSGVDEALNVNPRRRRLPPHRHQITLDDSR